MAERIAPSRAEPSPPYETEHAPIKNDFWTRLAKVEEYLAMAREILTELKVGRTHADTAS